MCIRDRPGNVAPASTVLTLNVDKAAGSVTLLSDLSKYYDGLPVADIAYSASAGRVTVEYKAYDAPDDKYTTEKPSAVGNYTVRVTVAESETHTGASATANFSIHYLPDLPVQAEGTLGSNGYYTSVVYLVPPSGYSLSLIHICGSRPSRDSDQYLCAAGTSRGGAVRVSACKREYDCNVL